MIRNRPNIGLARLLPAICVIAAAVVSPGCCRIPEDGLFDDPPPIVSVDPSLSPIQRAVRYLHNTQITADQEEALDGRDQAGNWPQYLGPPWLSVRDVNPFVPACVHHSLTQIEEGTAAAFGLGPEDTELAREMRGRALELLERFDAEGARLDAGTYGFWPIIEECHHCPRCPLLSLLFGVLFGLDDDYLGDRAPVNIPFFPRNYRVPSDADVTAKVFAARLAASQLDGEPPLPPGLEHFFEDWRDEGQEPMRIRFDWMPDPTGAYLTWLAYGADAPAGTPQDVDLIVNANVLFFLGRYGRLDAAGVHDAVSLINQATAEMRHHDLGQIASYYPDTLLFHYVVARAFAVGGVSGLAPSVEILADELEAEAIPLPDGRVLWDRGHPSLNTALAVLTLVNAGRAGELVEGGAHYLESTQDPLTGGWPTAPFFQATTATGIVIVWDSPAWSTAMALEALLAAPASSCTRCSMETPPRTEPDGFASNRYGQTDARSSRPGPSSPIPHALRARTR